MMRMPQLLQYAGQWNMKITTIKALQDYRKQHDTLVECAAVTHMPTRYGTFKAYGYRNLLNGEHHVALVKGEIGDGRDLLCRVHSECLTGDAFGSLRCDCGQQLAAAMAGLSRKAGEFSSTCARKAEASGFSISCGLTNCRIRAWIPWKPIWLWVFPGI